MRCVSDQSIVQARMLDVAYTKSVMLREARHMGVVLGLDTLRFYAVDIDIRSPADYTILKSQGVQVLAKDLKWLYSYFHPSLVRNMRPGWFIILTKRGCLGAGIFPEVPWHKQEKENIIKAVGLDIEYVKPSEAKEAEDRGAYMAVSDEEHAQIVNLRMEELSYHKIAELRNRSTQTIHTQVKSHNKSILRSGYCVRCRRVSGEYAETPARPRTSFLLLLLMTLFA